MGEVKKIQVEARHGRLLNQKMKPYVVLQYLMKETDENHLVTAYDIVGYLEACGIDAERRSIYKDIEAINRAVLMLEEECTIQEAEEMLMDEENEELKLIHYDKSRKGFYVKDRHFDPSDIRLLAECVYSAKFIAQGQAERLVGVVSEFVSKHQAYTIKHDALLTDRVKTNNKQVLRNIGAINDAMSRQVMGEPHTPEKIKFKYVDYTIDNLDKPQARRKGEWYVVSPWRLLINDGNYYLMGFDDKYQKILTFRVDRMEDVRMTGLPRDGEEEATATAINKYAQQSFSMFGGETQRVKIRFDNKMLGSVLDRFGRSAVVYTKEDDEHFVLTADVKVSEQFYGWLLGFGRKAQLIYPQTAVDEFKSYLDRVRDLYESC